MNALLLAAALVATATAAGFPSALDRAEKARKRGDPAAAIEAYTDALRAWRKSDGSAAKARALARRAELFEAGGELEKAIKDLTAAMTTEPRNASHAHRRGRLYLRLDDPSAALTDLYKATGLRLDYAEALYDRGRAYELLGEAKFAREDYRTSCKLGFKKACSASAVGASPGAAGKARSRPPAPPPQPEAEALGVQVRRKDLPAGASAAAAKRCARAVEDCSAQGETYGRCLGRVKTCESGGGKGCCPAACVKSFERVAAAVSEAAAFREVLLGPRPCSL